MKEQRLISFIEAEVLEQLGKIAPVDEDTLARLEANGVRPETASKKQVRSEVVYQVRHTPAHKPGVRSGKK